LIEAKAVPTNHGEDINFSLSKGKMNSTLLVIAYAFIALVCFGIIKAGMLLFMRTSHLKWALWHNAFALVAAGLWPLSIPIYAYVADSRERTWKPVYWAT